jgi:hypothetical protein
LFTNHELEAAYIDKRWNARLIDILHKFQKPQTQVINEQVGWSEKTNSFEFPQFSVANAKVESHGNHKLGLPYERILPGRACFNDQPKRRNTVMTRLAQSRPRIVCFWALFTLMVRNMLAKPKGWETLSIGLVIDEEHEDHKAGRLFQTIFDLPVYKVQRKCGSNGWRIGVKDEDFMAEMPAYVEVETSLQQTIDKLIISGKRGNVIAPVSKRAAQGGAVGDVWTFVNAGATTPHVGLLEEASYVLADYLVWLQRHNSQMPDGKTPLLQVLRSVETWVTTTFWKSKRADPGELFKQVRLALSGAETTGDGVGARFIDLLIRLQRDDQLPKSEKAHTLINFDKDSVKLALQPLEGRLHATGYAVPAHVLRKALHAEKLTIPHKGTFRVAIDTKTWNTRRRRHVYPKELTEGQSPVGKSDESQVSKPSSETVDSHASKPGPQS